MERKEGMKKGGALETDKTRDGSDRVKFTGKVSPVRTSGLN